MKITNQYLIVKDEIDHATCYYIKKVLSGLKAFERSNMFNRASVAKLNISLIASFVVSAYLY